MYLVVRQQKVPRTCNIKYLILELLALNVKFYLDLKVHDDDVTLLLKL